MAAEQIPLVDVAIDTDPGLPQAVQELRQRYGAAVTYARTWKLVVEGRVPSRRIGERIRLRRADYVLIARALGVEIPAAVAA